MSFLSAIGNVFGSGIVGSVERLASEFIETDMESAEAKALFIKTLDPNGGMRRQLSQFACKAYGWYLAVSLVLIVVHAFGVTDPAQSGEAIDAIKELFMPITASWASIVAASFGVNATNSIKGK